MPRGVRLDAPGALHHVIARGIERRDIYVDDHDRSDFLERLASIVDRGRCDVFAWCLLSSHFNLLIRTGPVPLSSCMLRLLTGYAARFNRRHHRCGHLFQNRFRSTLVDQDAYLVELVRYIHLNPVVAGMVALDDLNRYPWTGHSVLLGHLTYNWQQTGFVLAHFGPKVGAARKNYVKFVRDGWLRKSRHDLDGGGLRRSARGWGALDKLYRGRERWACDERVLGDGDFVGRVLDLVEGTHPIPVADPQLVLSELIDRVAGRVRLAAGDVVGNSKVPRAVFARALVSCIAVRHFGLSRVVVARRLSVSTQSVLRGVESGERALMAEGRSLAEAVAHLWSDGPD